MKTHFHNSIDRFKQEKFLLECYVTDIEVVADQLRNLRKNQQASLIESYDQILSDTSSSRNKITRVACVKILVTLLPFTLDLFEKYLKIRHGKQAYEIHFTIFCFLDELNVTHFSSKSKQRVLEAISEYLNNVRSEAGNAAWMAGDLLGDHWESDQAVEILLAIVQKGRYVAGRLGALHGLEERLRHTIGRSSLAKTIIGALGKVSHCDKSLRVRLYASHILQSDNKRGKVR